MMKKKRCSSTEDSQSRPTVPSFGARFWEASFDVACILFTLIVFGFGAVLYFLLGIIIVKRALGWFVSRTKGNGGDGEGGGTGGES